MLIRPQADAAVSTADYRRVVTWTERVELRARTISPAAFDTGLAVLLGLLALVSLYTQSVSPGLREPNGLGVLAAIAGSAPIAVRRRYPVCSLTLVLLVTGTYYGAGFPEGSLPLNSLILTYSVASWSPPRRAAVGLGVAIVAILAIGLTDPPDFETVTTMVFFVGGWLGGSTIRWRRESVDAELRAATERVEIDRQRAARLVAEERLRIAQELHDVVAHSMSVIAVQAGAGSHLLRDDPDEAQAALDAISATSRATLGEMRRLLGVLRGEDGARSNAPAPGVADIPKLVDDVRAVNIPAELRVRGQPEGTNAAVELSAYRIVQEALTNVIKHAGATTQVDVTLDYLPHELRIEVSDDGRGVTPTNAGHTSSNGTPGHGLVGMRERVEVWGGSLTTGARPGGGYRAQVSLPYGEPE